jgi:dolichyl-phosphate-mannose--protein O-mannosyl transferase
MSQVIEPAPAPPGTDGPPPASSAPRAPGAPAARHAKDEEPTEARLLRTLLGRRRLALDTTRAARFWAWAGTVAVTLLAAVLRLWELGRPHALVFDETYYVKDAFTLGREGYEAQWPDEPNPAFLAGDITSYLDSPAYVVHPPVGKWMIWLGMDLGGGATSSFAWRLASAVVGVLAVLLVIRIARRLFASSAMGVLAGLLLAVDGEAIVHSRTALLDQFLMFWVLVAFGCLVMDREWARRRLASRVAAILDAGGTVARYGPRLGFRWWRLAAGVSLGLACGVKWSGLYFVAVLGVLTVLWDLAARRGVGIGRWWEDSVLVDAVPAFVAIVPTAALTYVATWASWFVTPGAYMRRWAAENPGEGLTWLPAPLRSLWEYHAQMLSFHRGLDSEHAYAAHPIGWIVQWRPTSFHWERVKAGEAGCGADVANGCASAVTSLGNPVLWWLGAAALVAVVVLGILGRDWRATAVLSGVVAGWLPWFFFVERTTFTFYSIVFLPWVVLALVHVATVALERTEGRRGRARVVTAVVAVTAVVVLVSAAYYPVWTAMQVPYDYWRALMLLSSWI